MLASYWVENIGFFNWLTDWSSSGYAPTIGTLRGFVLVTGFYCGVIFIWVPSWFISWGFFWTTSLTGILRGTAGGFAFLNITARVFNASLFPCPNFTKGIAGSVFYIAYIISCAA